MATITSTLEINLVENATKKAPGIAAAIEKIEKDARALQAALAGTGASDRLQQRFAKLGATSEQIDGVARAWKDYAKAEGLAASAGDWTKAQAASVKNWESTAVQAVRDVRREEVLAVGRRREDAAKTEALQVAAAQRAARLAEQSARDAVRSAQRAAAEERQATQQVGRDAKRAAEQQTRDQAFFQHQATRDAERETRERIALQARETRELQRESQRRIQAERNEAEQRREAISRGGVGHFVAAGAAAAVSAHGIVRAGESAVEKGAELQHTRIAMEQAGIDGVTRKAIEDQALQLSARFGNVSQVAIMDLAKEARSVLQDTRELGPTTAVLAQTSVLDANDRTGGSSEGLGQLVEGAEWIGAAKLIDGCVKTIQVMGKTINPEQIYQFDKYLKAEGARVSDCFPITTGLSLAQEMGGSTAGKDIAQTAKEIIEAPPAPPATVPDAATPPEEETAEPRRGLRLPGFERIDGARALGVPVATGRTYLVGERGPELFQAGASGQVTNSRALMDAVRDTSTVSTADVQRVMAAS